MNSTWARWLAGIVFGLLVGRVGYGVVLPPLSSDPQWLADRPGLMIAVAVVIQLVVAVAVIAALMRAANMRRLLGWGFVLLGCVLLASVASTVLFSGLTPQDLVEADTRAQNDAVTAFWFWVLALGMPYVVGGLVLLIVGFFLLRSGRRQV